MKFVEIIPFTSAVLQSTSQSNPPARSPTIGGRVHGRLVSWSVVSNFPRCSGVQIHLLGWRAF